MNANATPDSPAQDPADSDPENMDQAGGPPAASDSEEPTWIEVGSPRRRTMPPAWSDEALDDAWVQTTEGDPSDTSSAALQVQLMQQASADDAPTAQSPAEHAAPEMPDAARDTADESRGDEGPLAEEPETAHEPETDQEVETAEEPETAHEPETDQEVETAEEPEMAQEPETVEEIEMGPWVQGPTEGTLREESGEEPTPADEPTSAEEPTAALPVEPPTEVLPAVTSADEASDEAATPDEAPTPDEAATPGEAPAAGEAPTPDEVPAPAEGPASSEDPTMGLDAQTAELVALDDAEEELGERGRTQDPQEVEELAALDGPAPDQQFEPDDDEVSLADERHGPDPQEMPPALGPEQTPAADEEFVHEVPAHDEAALEQPAAEADPGSGELWQVVPERDQTADAPHPSAEAPLPAMDAPHPTAPDPYPTAPDPLPTAPDPHPTAPDPRRAGAESQQLQPAAGRREGTGTLGGAIDVIAPHLRPHRPALIVGLVALVLSIWLLVALPFPLKHAVDAALATAGVDTGRLGGAGPDPGGSLLASAGLLALMVALQAGLRALSVSVLNRAGGRVATDLRSRLLRHLHRLSPGRDIDDLDRTTQPLVEDVARLRDLVAHAGPRIAAGLFALASLLVVLLVVEPLAALIVAVTSALYALVARGSLRQARRKDAGAKADELALSETAEELLSATRTIQSYGLEARAGRGLAEAGARAGRSRAAARRARTVGDALAELIAGAGVAAALLLSGPRMSAGAMTPGELTLVLAYVLIAVVLTRAVVQHSGTLKATISAGDRLGELLDHRAGITEPERTQPIDRVRGEVVFSAISAPGPRGPLFEAVSLVIPAGQHVAMLDRAGGESSALLSYLLRFDQPETGRVLLDRYDTRAVPLADLRRQIAVVQREPALFTDTVRENIRVGRPEATDDEVVRAARSAGAEEFITLLPDGYDTPLPRHGTSLSDGQRRRIAIARALLRDAPIVVLDSADADIAPTERETVRQGLEALVVGRTALIHSSDPDSILTADRVLWLESGEIIEDGEPRELAQDPDSWLSAWIRTAEETGG